jgi:predicted O-linked N-acetylglucosamine transferase (SPINDLY family)
MERATPIADDEAVIAYQTAIVAEPQSAALRYNLGILLRKLGRASEALAAYRQAVDLQPDFAEAHNNLGNLLAAHWDPESAVQSLRSAVRLRPDFAEAWNNLGVALKNLGQIDEAIGCFDRALALRPDQPAVRSNKVYALEFHADADEQRIAAAREEWNLHHAKPLQSRHQPPANDRDSSRRLRVGYISPNFRDHCQSLFTLPLLSNHNHAEFEIFCYSDGGGEDVIREKLRREADEWRDISELADSAVVQRIREDRIDILVDLTQHMSRNRLPVFAEKPAPVQISWLAYPGGSGVAGMDYRLTDPHLEERAGRRPRAVEEPLALPSSFWCYEPRSAQPVDELPALSEGFVTFACLNNFCKLNDAVLKLWSRVLRAVARSRLILLVPRGSARQRVLDILRAEGIASDRISQIDFQPREKYLATYRQIDIALDTFPYNGHTTNLDALWMGVPVVTRIGSRCVGRGGWSQLCNLGLAQLAARSDEQFVNIAAGLAENLPALNELRQSLRSRMENSALMRAEPFARGVEEAYRRAWIRWVSSR